MFLLSSTSCVNTAQLYVLYYRVTHVLANLHATCRYKDARCYCSRRNTPVLTSATEIFPFSRLSHCTISSIWFNLPSNNKLLFYVQGRVTPHSQLAGGLRDWVIRIPNSIKDGVTGPRTRVCAVYRIESHIETFLFAHCSVIVTALISIP